MTISKLLYVIFIVITKQKPIVDTQKTIRKESMHTNKESH